jgi:putative membrane protein
MAFGFLIEKFDLFISYIGKAIGEEDHFRPSLSAEIVGLGLFLVGVLIIVTATVRFFTYRQFIEADESIPYTVRKTNILLSSLMILLAFFLFFYMAHQVVG